MNHQVLPPEPGLTPAEVVARAERFAAGLQERQAETEKRTYYAEDTHEEFRAAGFYRILVPRRYGGYEFGIDTFMRVVMALTRGCASTGWMYCLSHAHAQAVATMFDRRAQDELFASGDFLCPATVAPSGTAARVDGGWELEGVWKYCSGSPYATHFLGHTLVSQDGGEPAPMLFVAPRSRWTRLDDWGHTLGLRGSGSHSIAMSGGRIPDHLTLDTHLSMISGAGGTPGLALHSNPLYGGGLLSFMVLEDAVLAVGMAQAALEAYEELMRTRSTIFPPIVSRTEDPDFQRHYGEATGLIATAEAAFLHTLQQWDALGAAGPDALTHEGELRIATMCREIVRLCWTAVESHLVPTAGSGAMRSGTRMERVWRDMSMLHGHAGVAVFLSGIAQRDYARARFGVA